jgi:membrane protein
MYLKLMWMQKHFVYILPSVSVYDFFIRYMDLVGILKKTILEFASVNYYKESAALSFFLLFSIPALTMLLAQTGSFLFEATGYEAATSRSLADAFGVPIEGVDILIGNYQAFGGSFLLNIFGALVLAYSATTVLTELRNSLNRLWGIESKASIVSSVRDRIISFTSILAFSLIFLTITLIKSLLSVFSNQISHIPWFPLADTLLYTAFLNVISAGLMFILIFKLIPNKHLKWGDALAGASVTVALFTVGKYLLDLYLQTISLDSIYGAAGGILIFMAWIYYNIQILFFGAIFTKHFEIEREKNKETKTKKTPKKK